MLLYLKIFITWPLDLLWDKLTESYYSLSNLFSYLLTLCKKKVSTGLDWMIGYPLYTLLWRLILEDTLLKAMDVIVSWNLWINWQRFSLKNFLTIWHWCKLSKGLLMPAPLGRFSEHELESAHYAFDKIWQSPQFGKSLLKAVLTFNTNNMKWNVYWSLIYCCVWKFMCNYASNLVKF